MREHGEKERRDRANQSRAALALLVATVWLANWDDDKQLVSTGAPLVFMLAFQSVIAFVLVGLIFGLVRYSISDIREARGGLDPDAITGGGGGGPAEPSDD